jgi:hypothetical protein
MSPAIKMLTFAAITATGTIMALISTMFSNVHDSDIKFRQAFYESLKRMVIFGAADFIGSGLLLAVVSIPFGEANAIPASWLNLIYCALIFANASISGLLVVVILTLFDGLKSMIHSLKTG